MNPVTTQLQQRLGHAFARPELLERALTHRSFSADHNERLEFLGDAVLSLAVSSLLYERLGGADEGELTRIRAHLVREDSLYKLALAAGFPGALRLSEGEARGGGAQRPSILADALEAVIGAAYLDGGFDAATGIVTRLFAEVVADVASSGASDWGKDAKTALQEWLQARKLPVPGYRILETRGQQHEQLFVVECAVPSLNLLHSGEGRSRRAAEQDAARRMLDELVARDQPGSGLRD
ncbi:MAG: ribonuclease III [Pelomonas sp.]|nr:ribonuclease III [Roseateles sp.]